MSPEFVNPWDSRALERRTMWFDKALADDRFETWYQPVVATDRRELAGHECLIRYTSEGANGRLHKSTEIVEAARVRRQLRLFDACARALAVRSASLQHHLTGCPGPFFVNFLPGSMLEPEEEMRAVSEILAASRLHPSELVFEAVEADKVGDSARLRRIRDYMRRQGFGFALDNLGFGANSMQAVADVAPDYIKIDKNVVWNLEQPIYAATVRNLVEICEDRGIQVIATGVHRRHMMENLWLLGVKVMQGHLFGRPLPGVVQMVDSMAVEMQSAESDLSQLALAVGIPRLEKNAHPMSKL